MTIRQPTAKNKSVNVHTKTKSKNKKNVNEHAYVLLLYQKTKVTCTPVNKYLKVFYVNKKKRKEKKVALNNKIITSRSALYVSS